jgi:Sigma-70, region 4
VMSSGPGGTVCSALETLSPEQELFASWLVTLPSAERDVMVMRLAGGYSSRDTAAVLGIHERDVRARYRRTLLRNGLANRNPDRVICARARRPVARFRARTTRRIRCRSTPRGDPSSDSDDPDLARSRRASRRAAGAA